MTGHDDNMRKAAVFAESVRREMRDLPTEQVADLTDGLEADMVASLADGGSLPDAVVYAHDLMRAAGIEGPGRRAAGTRGRIIATGSRVWAWLRHSVRGLAPAWWVFRAWVLMQVIGRLVAYGGSPYWFLGQWGGNELLGVLVFVVLIYVSVRAGREGWLLTGRTEKVVSALLAVASVFVLVSRPSYGRAWFGYVGPSNATVAPWTGCAATVPELIDSPVSDAVDVLQREGFGHRVVDPTGYDLTNSAGVGNFRVLDQDPRFDTVPCGQPVTLMIDPSGGGAQTSLHSPDTVPATTTAPVVTTTTVPKSTTTKPRATTTTTP